MSDAMETACGSKRCASPIASENSSSSAPPTASGMPAFSGSGFGRRGCDTTEPAAHASSPAMITAIGHPADREVSPPATRSATPNRPTVSPIRVRPDGRAPRIHSMSASQKGSVATRSAAIPDERRCSDQARAA